MTALEEDHSSKQNSNWALALPDEMWKEIFTNLSTQDRVQIGLTCKRFRSLDFALGKKTFNRIYVKCTYDGVLSFSGAASDAVIKFPENYFADSFDQEPVLRNTRPFKQAHTEVLMIQYDLKKKNAANFLTDIIMNQQTIVNGVYLSWNSDLTMENTASAHNINGIRKTLMQLSKFEKLKIDLNQNSDPVHITLSMDNNILIAEPVITLRLRRMFFTDFATFRNNESARDMFGLVYSFVTCLRDFHIACWTNPENWLLDDASLLHIVTNTNHAELCVSACTAHGIMDVFEVVAQSKFARKVVLFYFPATTFDALLNMDIGPSLEMNVEKPTYLRIMDKNRNSLLTASRGSDIAWSEICKIDANGKPTYEGDFPWTPKTTTPAEAVLLELDAKLLAAMREKAGARLAEIGVTGVTKEAVAEIVCALIDEHLKALHVEQTTDWTPLLPDEIWMEIFSLLTIRERAPLGLICRRFRNLDRKLGFKKLDKIEVLARWRKLSISVVEHETKYELCEKTTKPNKNKKDVFNLRAEEFIPPSDHILDYFRKSQTELLYINISHADNLPAKFDSLTRVIETITFKKLIICFENVEESCDSFLYDLLRNRNLKCSQVSLTWANETEKGASLASLQQTRNFLQHLPSIDKLKIHWIGAKPKQRPSDLEHPNDRLIDDATLLHIVSNTNYAVLCMSDCTVLGILNAFAVVSQSENKYAHFLVPRETFDRLSAMKCETLHKKYVNGVDLHFADRARKYVMVARPYPKYAYINMGRMTDDESIVDKWPKNWEDDDKFD